MEKTPLIMINTFHWQSNEIIQFCRVSVTQRARIKGCQTNRWILDISAQSCVCVFIRFLKAYKMCFLPSASVNIRNQDRVWFFIHASALCSLLLLLLILLFLLLFLLSLIIHFTEREIISVQKNLGFLFSFVEIESRQRRGRWLWLLMEQMQREHFRPSSG